MGTFRVTYAVDPDYPTHTTEFIAEGPDVTSFVHAAWEARADAEEERSQRPPIDGNPILIDVTRIE